MRPAGGQGSGFTRDIPFKLLDLSAIDDKNTKVSVIAETHQAIDWGQTGERVDRFFQEVRNRFTLDAHQPKDHAERLGGVLTVGEASRKHESRETPSERAQGTKFSIRPGLSRGGCVI